MIHTLNTHNKSAFNKEIIGRHRILSESLVKSNEEKQHQLNSAYANRVLKNAVLYWMNTIERCLKLGGAGSIKHFALCDAAYFSFLSHTTGCLVVQLNVMTRQLVILQRRVKLRSIWYIYHCYYPNRKYRSFSWEIIWINTLDSHS